MQDRATDSNNLQQMTTVTSHSIQVRQTTLTQFIVMIKCIISSFYVPSFHCADKTFMGSLTLDSGPGSSVGIATGYGLDGPEIESRWGRDFLHLSRLALGPT